MHRNYRVTQQNKTEPMKEKEMKPVACITAYREVFDYYAVIQDTGLIYVHIKDLEDVRCREFSSYQTLPGYTEIKNFYEVIEAVKAKIR